MSFRLPSIDDFPYFQKYNNLSEKINKQYLKAGCPKPDCIPSIDNPKWLTHDKIREEWGENEELLVVIVAKNNTTKTYGFPLTILDYHEVVNFEAPIPLSLTYCPLCQTATSYKREVNGNEIQLGVSGLLYNSALILYDRKSLSLFSQVYSKGILGKFAGEILHQLPVVQTTLGRAMEQFPDISILSKETGFPNRKKKYGKYPYQNYKKKPDVHFPTNDFDDRLHPKKIVIKLSFKKKNYIIAPHNKVNPYQIHPEFYSIPYAGGILFFSGNTPRSKPDWNKWIPSTISFYFAARAHFPNSTLLL